MRIDFLKLMLGSLFVFAFVSTSQAEVSLSLDPSAKSVGLNSEFALNMNIANTNNDPLSFLNVWLSFDPNYLQVLDRDTDNWITDDINVLDGPYHNNFTWDFHGQNTADNVNGTISYGEGAWDNDNIVNASGTFAQVWFLAKMPVLNTSIKYLFTGTGGLDDTYAYDSDFDNILSGTANASVSVTPEPLSVVLYVVGSSVLALFGFRKRQSLKLRKE